MSQSIVVVGEELSTGQWADLACSASSFLTAHLRGVDVTDDSFRQLAAAVFQFLGMSWQPVVEAEHAARLDKCATTLIIALAEAGKRHPISVRCAKP